VDLFEVDGTRYLIARSFPTENDSDVGIERFKEKYNADLANNLGNLVSRVCKLGEGLTVNSYELRVDEKYTELINNLRLDEAINLVFEKYIDKSNNRLNEVTPWKLEANDPNRIAVLTECAQNLRIAATALLPIMPEISKKILEQLDGKIKPLESGLFPRIK
jgi:methionyl-tRNA synthetase